jgi:hypothetical protein
MASTTTTAQQLRAAVKLTKPGLLADVPSDYNPRQVFNFLRHKATNYEALIEQHRQKYGDVTPAEIKALTQGAADVVVNALRAENDDLLSGKPNTIFAKFSRKLIQLMRLGPDVDLQAIYEATKTLKRSQLMFKSWNERYRRQKEMILKLMVSADPELRQNIEDIYSANSKDKLDQLEEALFNG